ncbi:MAG: PLP-dependent cysteine synthase family protein [Gammaproteobacteria bacterium]
MQSWVQQAVRKIEADFQRSADTHLIKLDIPAAHEIQLYLKDESSHPTGSLKHRLARSLFLYGLCNGWIKQGTPIIEASSGSTAVSEAYFARLLGLRFIAVMPQGTSRSKIDQIAFYGGESHLVGNGDIYSEATRLANELQGHYMDQFTYAERATDWHGNNNIAESIFGQMAREDCPVPEWVVVSAGTGGTSATIGRYIHYKCFNTRLCVADPENSVFYDAYQTGDRNLTLNTASRIEGIGRPKVEPSFIPSVIDRMIKVPDAASIATIHFLESVLNRKCGGSTGTNLYAAFQVIAELHAEHRHGSVVTLLCDAGDRYLDSYYNPEWLTAQGFDLQPYLDTIGRFCETGRLESKA